MSYKEFIDKVKPEFEKALKFLEGELAKIRTSRASPAFIEEIEVDYFGSKYSLKQLAAISCPQPNQIVIQPWDTSYIEAIEKAVLHSGLAMSLAADKNIIRLNLPVLTEDYRRSLVKILNEKSEQTRQTIRYRRDDIWSKIQQAQREKKITEDDKFHGKESLQKLVDEYNEKIKNLTGKKEKELL